MKTPISFKKAQQRIFQDKTISLRPKQQNIGSLGSVTISPGAISGTYLVNCQLITDEVVAREWGLTLARDAFITRSESAPIDEKDYIQYGGVVYQVVGCPHQDSYFKWMLKATDEAVI